jgi:hypothetical protein
MFSNVTFIQVFRRAKSYLVEIGCSRPKKACGNPCFSREERMVRPRMALNSKEGHGATHVPHSCEGTKSPPQTARAVEHCNATRKGRVPGAE